MKKILIFTLTILFSFSSFCHSAGNSWFGTLDVADNSTALTGTNALKAVTPASMRYTLSDFGLLDVSARLLTSKTLALNADGNTTLYTVPAGKTAILTHAILIGGGNCTSTTLTIGRAGALTDFLGAQTLSNLDAAGDVLVLAPIQNATPVKMKTYAAGTIIKGVVASHAGLGESASNTIVLYGRLY
jgi:hypothetical protein